MIFLILGIFLQTKVSLSAQEIDSSDSEPYSVGTFTFEPEAGFYILLQRIRRNT